MRRTTMILAVVVATAAQRAAHANDCLKPEPTFVPETTFVALSFVSPESNDALMAQKVIEDDRGRWIVRACDDPKLLERIKHGDSAQLDQLLSRRIVLVLFQKDTVIKHLVVPYELAHVTRWREVPPALEFDLCPGNETELLDACARYATSIRGVLAAAVALAGSSSVACGELESVNSHLNEALLDLDRTGAAHSRLARAGAGADSRPNEPGLRDFVAQRLEELKVKLATDSCGLRPLNARLLEERRSARLRLLTDSGTVVAPMGIVPAAMTGPR